MFSPSLRGSQAPESHSEQQQAAKNFTHVGFPHGDKYNCDLQQTKRGLRFVWKDYRKIEFKDCVQPNVSKMMTIIIWPTHTEALLGHIKFKESLKIFQFKRESFMTNNPTSHMKVALLLEVNIHLYQENLVIHMECFSWGHHSLDTRSPKWRVLTYKPSSSNMYISQQTASREEYQNFYNAE